MPTVHGLAVLVDGGGLHHACRQLFEKRDALVSNDQAHRIHVSPDREGVARSVDHEFDAQGAFV